MAPLQLLSLASKQDSRPLPRHGSGLSAARRHGCARVRLPTALAASIPPDSVVRASRLGLATFANGRLTSERRSVFLPAQASEDSRNRFGEHVVRVWTMVEARPGGGPARRAAVGAKSWAERRDHRVQPASRIVHEPHGSGGRHIQAATRHLLRSARRNPRRRTRAAAFRGSRRLGRRSAEHGVCAKRRQSLVPA